MSLERALDLADAAAGRGYPNPTVGAVVVSAAGEVVGEGVSEPAGGRHAEVVALDAAAGRARGGTLFVTLEPCAHHGRTPPCVDRILAEGLARVVAASGDPSGRPAAAPSGCARRGWPSSSATSSAHAVRTRPGGRGLRWGAPTSC